MPETGRHEVEPPGAVPDGAAPDGAGPDGAGAQGRPARSSHRVAGVLIGVLVALLGFGIAVQLHASSGNSLATARQDDLVRILDDQNSRAARLQQQLAQLQATESQLQASGDKASVAYTQAESQLTALKILLGLIPATGPGITLTITDPDHQLGPEDLLDVVQELRGAGAEAIQFDTVRVGTDSAFTGSGSGESAPRLDGTTLAVPYQVLAIGDPPTLDRALNIFGGVAATVRAAGGTATIVQQPTVLISATRALPPTSLLTPAK